MAWTTPKTNWAPGDIPTETDFNRIEQNIRDRQVFISGTIGGPITGGATTDAANVWLLCKHTATVPNTESFVLRWVNWRFFLASHYLLITVGPTDASGEPGAGATTYSGPYISAEFEPDTTMYTNSSGSTVHLTVRVDIVKPAAVETLPGYMSFAAAYSIG